MRVGRNELCPCGSGKKYKSCCEGKARTSRGLMLLLLAIGAIVIIGVGSFIASSRAAKAPIAGAVSGGAQPGPAPPGKVWSTEHGHWHDVNPNAAAANAPRPSAQPAAAPTTPQPQPPGPVPAGKVWSAEHGHWHDAPR